MLPTADKVTVASALASVALIGLILSIGALMFINVPEKNRDLLNVALMALIGNTGTAFGYFLGSSESSKKKDDVIAELVPPKGDTTTTTTTTTEPPKV